MVTGARNRQSLGEAFRVAGFTIRRYRLSDAVSLHQAINRRSISRNMGAIMFPYTERAAQLWIRRCLRRYQHQPLQHLNLAITSNGKIVGGLGVERQDAEAEIGYWLIPSLWGRGHMTKIIRRFIRYIFSLWPVDRLTAQTFLYNPASGRVLEKNGFRKVALRVHAVQKGKQRFDTNVFLYQPKK